MGGCDGKRGIQGAEMSVAMRTCSAFSKQVAKKDKIEEKKNRHEWTLKNTKTKTKEITQS